jgi:hypothetical protein
MTADQKAHNVIDHDRRIRSESLGSVLPPSRTGSKNDDYGDKIEEAEHVSQSSIEDQEDAEEANGGADDVEKATAAPVEKKDTRISVNNISSVPNGGLRAWMQVVGSFFIFYNTWSVRHMIEMGIHTWTIILCT